MSTDWLMQFRRLAIVVWVTTRDDAGPTWTATAGGQICVVEPNSVVRQLVNVRRASSLVPVTTEVVPADVVSNEQNNIGAIIGRCADTERQQEQKR